MYIVLISAVFAVSRMAPSLPRTATITAQLARDTLALTSSKFYICIHFLHLL